MDVLIIYNRFDRMELSKYPFIIRLVEELAPKLSVAVVDFGYGNNNELKKYIHHYYPARDWRIPKLYKFSAFIAKCLTLFLVMIKRPKTIIVLGSNAINYIPSLKGRSKTLIYLDDEFPWLFRQDMEVVSGILSYCDSIISFDQFRSDFLKKKLNLTIKREFILPNVPSKKLVQTIAETDWISEFNLNPDLKYVLFHASIHHFTMISEVLVTMKLWPQDVGLIIIGFSTEGRDSHYEIYKHLLNEKVFTSNRYLNDSEYNSIIKFCFSSFCLYSLWTDLDYVGMSSGKIMRCLLLNRPVITNNYISLQFVKEKNFGVLIEEPLDIPCALEAVKNIEIKEDLKTEIDMNYKNFSDYLLDNDFKYN